MSLRHAILITFEGATTQTWLDLPFAALEISGGAAIINTNGYKNTSGTRGHDNSFRFTTAAANSATRVLCKPRKRIPWEEFLIERAVYHASTLDAQAVILANVTTRCCEFNLHTNGQVRHLTGGTSSNFLVGIGTVQGASAAAAIPQGDWSWTSHHVSIAASGFMTTWVNTLTTATLETVGINTQGNGVTDIDGIVLSGYRSAQTTQCFIRPICMVIDGVASGTPAAAAALAGVTESATVYAWETQTTDSEGLGGDPELAASEMRLFLRGLSFSPADIAATGWADNEAVTVAGVTGTLLVNAPAANYRKGLEPGSVLLGRKLWLERLVVNATGTNNADGTLGGGATDRADALIVFDDGKHVAHTAAAEKVTANTAPVLSQGTVDEIMGVVAIVQGLADGAAPNAVRPLLIDNAVELGGGADAVLLGVGNTIATKSFELNAAGGQFTVGAGAGGLDGIEVGYGTETA